MNKTIALPGGLRSTTSPQASSDAHSLNLFPLPKLLDMFRGHAATDRRDKVYALLGLSTDLRSSELQVDYARSWSALFREVILYIFGPSTTITTWDLHDQAIITGPGYPLGTIKVNSELNTARVWPPDFLGIDGQRASWKAEFPLPMDYGMIQDGDILCLLEGARQPSVIRRRGKNFNIVLATLGLPSVVTIIRGPLHNFGPLFTYQKESVHELTWEQFTRHITYFPCQFDLVWDWLLDDQQCEVQQAVLLEKASQTNHAYSSDALRMLNTARILEATENVSSLRDLLALRTPSSSPPASQAACSIKQYLDLYENIWDNWSVYVQLKTCILQLRWCCWFLSNTEETDIVCGFWSANGINGPDLVEILSLVHRSNTGMNEPALPLIYLDREIVEITQLSSRLSGLRHYSAQNANSHCVPAHSTISTQSQVSPDKIQTQFREAGCNLVHTVLAEHRGKVLCVKRVLELHRSEIFLNDATGLAILIFLELSEPTPSVVMNILGALRDNHWDHLLRHYVLHHFAASRGESCKICRSTAKS
jgi:hypothetical protein